MSERHPRIDWAAFRPRKGPRLAGLIAAGLFAAGVVAALAYGLSRPDRALRWPTVAGVVGNFAAPVCLLILVLAALREARPPARLALSLPALLLAILSMALLAASPAQTGNLNLFCFAPLTLLLALVPLLSALQTPAFLRAERQRARGEQVLAYLAEHDGLLVIRDAARALGVTEPALRTLLVDLEGEGDLAGVAYPDAGVYVSAPGEEAGVVRVEAALAEGAPRDAAALAERLGVPVAVVADWLAQTRGDRQL